MAKSKTQALKEYLGKAIEGYQPIELVDSNDLWEELIFPYLASKFKLHEKTVKRIMSKYVPYMYYRSIPLDLYIDAYAQNWVDGLCIDSIDSWYRTINTIEGYDYCSCYYGQFYLSEISNDIPDYYDPDNELTIWIYEEIERLLIDLGYWLDNGEGSGSDLYICTDYHSDMYIEHITLITDNGTEYIDDRLMIEQLCSDLFFLLFYDISMIVEMSIHSLLYNLN